MPKISKYFDERIKFEKKTCLNPNSRCIDRRLLQLEARQKIGLLAELPRRKEDIVE